MSTLTTSVCSADAATDDPTEQWFALWTRSHCEWLVHDHLAAVGFRLLLPTIDVWSKQRGARRIVRLPMFPGYLFLRHALDKKAHVEIRKARGLVRVLGDGDQPAAVSDKEIGAIENVVKARGPVMPHPFLRDGHRVRVVRGPLIGLEGILTQTKPAKGLLVVSVDLLQKSVAIVVDCTDVVPT